MRPISILLAALLCLSAAGCSHQSQPPTTPPAPRFAAFVPGSNGTLASDTAFVSGQPSNADYTSPAISAAGAKVLGLVITLDGSSSPVGAFSVLASWNCSDYDAIALDVGKVAGTTNGSTYSHTGGTTVAYSGSSNSRFQIAVENPAPCMKVLMDQSSGGTTGSRLAVQYYLIYPPRP